jgi:hypothetical protein
MRLGYTRRTALAVLFAIGSAATALAQAPPDTSPSWNDGAVKKSIIDFVARVTAPGGADFVPPDERIANFRQ